MFSKKDALNMSFCGHNCLSFMPSRLIVHGPGVQISHGVNLSYFSALIVKQLQSYMQMIKKRAQNLTQKNMLYNILFYHPLTSCKPLMRTFHSFLLVSKVSMKAWSKVRMWRPLWLENDDRTLRRGSRWIGNKSWS